MPAVFYRPSPAEPTEVYDTYWRFAAERQAIFFRRFRSESFPWTTDPILARHKFTNAFRASDRVSQYLIKQVIYEGDQSPREVFFRTLLFKVFNRIDTWELLAASLGSISYSSYSFAAYDTVLSKAIESGTSIFSAAYMMPSGTRVYGDTRKHRSFLKLIEKMIVDELPLRLRDAKSMLDAFNILRSYPMIGDFLAYQYITDLNYSELTNFSEMEFVIPGPGSLSGIKKCFKTLGEFSSPDIIRMVAEAQEEEFSRRGLTFESLWGRRLQLIDCQNLFCETDKYARIAHPSISGLGGRTRIKQVFHPRNEDLDYWYPPKWGINQQIAHQATSATKLF